jgi:hypothetical protein
MPNASGTVCPSAQTRRQTGSLVPTGRGRNQRRWIILTAGNLDGIPRGHAPRDQIDGLHRLLGNRQIAAASQAQGTPSGPVVRGPPHCALQVVSTPLYCWAKDAKPGDTTGQGVNGVRAPFFRPLPSGIDSKNASSALLHQAAGRLRATPQS